MLHSPAESTGTPPRSLKRKRSSASATVRTHCASAPAPKTNSSRRWKSGLPSPRASPDRKTCLRHSVSRSSSADGSPSPSSEVSSQSARSSRSSFTESSTTPISTLASPDRESNCTTIPQSIDLQHAPLTPIDIVPSRELPPDDAVTDFFSYLLQQDIPERSMKPPMGYNYDALPSYKEIVDDTYLSDFGHQVCEAYEVSQLRQRLRVIRYGKEVASVYCRGNTPEEDREAYRNRMQKQLDDFEASAALETDDED